LIWNGQYSEIFIPAELPKYEAPVLNEGAPIHELTHAIELLITRNPNSLPLWFREGLANQHFGFWVRVMSHVLDWLDRDKMLTDKRVQV
jgi:hypothetical protein